MAQTVIGFFDKISEAQQAVEQLVNNGFSRDNIDVSNARDDMPTDNTNAVPGTMGTATTYDDTTTRRNDDNESGIGKFFSSLFGSDDDTNRTENRDRASTYGQVASQSDAIVTVHAVSDEEAERAADILDEAGAFDVDERAAQYGLTDKGITGMQGTDRMQDAAPVMQGTDRMQDAAPARPVDTDRVDTEGTISVIQEDLQIGKRMTETGGVRVRSRIVEKPVEESLRLREERVRIQRTPVDRVATDADMTAFQEGEISMTEHAEVPVVNKEARVVEEISVNREVNERTETVRDTVRNTEVDVDDTTNANRNAPNQDAYGTNRPADDKNRPTDPMSR